MLKAIINGNSDVEDLSGLAKGKLSKKKDDLKRAFNSRTTGHHRAMIGLSLKHIEYMEALITEIDLEIDKLTQDNNLRESVALLDTIPGVNEKAAETIIAEIGTDMTKFPSAIYLSSWAGMSPGNNESAGRRKSGRTTPGNKWIKAILTQCALCASQTKGSYLKDKYYKLKSRRGAKRAVIAIGHKILVIAYHILKDGVTYKELGESYLDNRNKTRVLRHHVNRIKNLGYEVSLAEKVA